METASNRDLVEIMRDGMVMRDRIADLLREEPKTVPELAEALGYPSYEVMLWVMEMWRYGTVVEMEKSRTDDYFTYRLKETD